MGALEKDDFFAPVLVTVCNRNEHFKRCLDSLVNCTGFSDTEIFIAVDYPPSEKYQLGYKKVIEITREYLKYNNIHFLIRERNYGVLENYVKLIKYVLDELNYKKYIYIEDDSEVASNFLSYCNKCLEEFLFDDSICGVCGSSQVWYGIGFKENKKCEVDYLKKNKLIWHGYATWKKEYLEIEKFCKEFEKCFEISNIKIIHKTSRCFFYSLLERYYSKPKQLPWEGKRVYPIDFVWDIYMFLNDKYFIFPTINKVRDWGMDGSGEHFKSTDINSDIISGMQLDERNEFDIVNIPVIDYSELEKHDKYGTPRYLARIKRLFYYIFDKII